MTTTTLPAPRRIGTLQYLAADLAVRLGFEPDHIGADWPHWEAEIRAMRCDRTTGRHHSRASDTPTALIPTIRRPIAALTAQPHYEAVDDLGPWNPSQHPLMPAYLAGETAVNTVNSGSAS